jgi:hypothetical protein
VSRRLTPLFAAFFAVLLVALRAHALTTPIAGAVALPANANMLLPFPAGANVRVLSGYSPTGGSSLHADTDATSKANDYYALDLDYADEPNGGKGLPLVAPLAGTVIKAGWATSGWANYGQRVILEHDLGDGHVYHSLYAHMNAIDAAIVEGASVAQGQVLGELGQSCQGALSCGSFSAPHLHFALHRDSTVGGSGTGGSYGGNAVVPEPFDGYEDLVQGMTMISSNGGTVVCGDGYCNGGETAASCPADCACATIPAVGRTVDDSEKLCFTRSGSPQYWYTTNVGNDGGAYWTHATDAAAADDVGTWSLDFDETGQYRVEAYVEPGFAGTMQAAYVVGESGGPTTVTVDQSASTGWIALGDHGFSQGKTTISLADNTGEPFSAMAVIAFDAIRVTRLDLPPTTGSGGGGAGGSAAGPSGAGGGDTSSGAGGDGMQPDGEVDGCNCTTSAPAGSGALGRLLAIGIALGLARRSRARRLAARGRSW